MFHIFYSSTQCAPTRDGPAVSKSLGLLLERLLETLTAVIEAERT